MTDFDRFTTTLKATLPPPDTDERREWIKAAMDIITEAIIEHSDGDLSNAAFGMSVLLERAFDLLRVKRQAARLKKFGR